MVKLDSRKSMIVETSEGYACGAATENRERCTFHDSREPIAGYCKHQNGHYCRYWMTLLVCMVFATLAGCEHQIEVSRILLNKEFTAAHYEMRMRRQLMGYNTTTRIDASGNRTTSRTPHYVSVPYQKFIADEYRLDWEILFVGEETRKERTVQWSEYVSREAYEGARIGRRLVGVAGKDVD
jgi:hypothetical protein